MNQRCSTHLDSDWHLDNIHDDFKICTINFSVFPFLEADPVIPESVPIRSESPELHWICWPEPKKNKSAKRPYTSLGLYTDRKFSGNQTPRNDRVRIRSFCL